MKNLERDGRRKKGAIGSQDGGFRTFVTENRARPCSGATCSRDGGADITVYSVCSFSDHTLWHPNVLINTAIPILEKR